MKALKNLWLSVFVLLSISLFAQKQYSYQTVPNDPMGVRIYTLDNGLKVYLSPYHDVPRIAAYVAVRAGGKNDPKETTGLAHYFEHMMFKGTPNFGTTDWTAEEPLIQAIENQFEIYRVTTDSLQRAVIYHKIDSLSYEASKYAIPNEYMKMMNFIGSQHTNAYTTNDETIFMEEIPSNQVENWAKIQSDRFSQNVLRLFHTEIETVYEEKNMAMSKDSRRSTEALFAALFPTHPYGTQTVLGTQEDLKNPSMKNIREFFDKYYVPNNMAICMSGDFDPDKMIAVIDKYFGTMVRKADPSYKFTPEAPITKPVEREITGLEAANMALAYRMGGSNTPDALMGNLIGMILYNGQAGMIDLNLNQKQRLMGAYTYMYGLDNYSTLIFGAYPKQGQTLEECKDLLLEQIELLKKGDFPDWMIAATVNNLKYEHLKMLESNGSRAEAMAKSYTQHVEWEQDVNYLDRLSKITKADIVKFANDNFKDNYVVLYKRQGQPTDIAKMTKPAITPIQINRDVESKLFKEIRTTTITPIEPVFLDYTKDLQTQKLKNGLEMFYSHNEENGTFQVVYRYEMGSENDKEMSTAFSYLEYLGTSKYTPEQLKQEFYKLACSFSLKTGAEQMYISLSGLSENMEPALKLFEELLTDCKPNGEAWENLKSDILKARVDSKGNQQANLRALVSYSAFGSDSPFKNILSEQELNALTPQKLTDKIKMLNKYQHQILYYGPLTMTDFSKQIEKLHKVGKVMPFPAAKKYELLETNTDRVVFLNYESNQSYCQTVSRGGKYDPAITPQVSLYNEYFGGSMNAIVFTEIREKRSLAYSAGSWYSEPSKADKYYSNRIQLATQNDKVVMALDAFNELFADMPVSEKTLSLAKEAIINTIRVQRIDKMNIIWDYLHAKDLGLNYDIRKDVFTKVPTFTMEDMQAFQAKYVKNLHKTYLILGRESDMDFKTLETKFGTVQKVSQEDVFGY